MINVGLLSLKEMLVTMSIQEFPFNLWHQLCCRNTAVYSLFHVDQSHTEKL